MRCQDAYSITRIKNTKHGEEIIDIEHGIGMFKQTQSNLHQDSKNVSATVTLTVLEDSQGYIGDIVNCYGTEFIIVDIWLQEKMIMYSKRYKNYTLQARIKKNIGNLNP